MEKKKERKSQNEEGTKTRGLKGKKEGRKGIRKKGRRECRNE